MAVTLDAEPVLRGVDLHVPAGTITTLIGASGTGKSTLVKHLLGLLCPDEGSVVIGTADVWASTPAELLELRRNLSALHSGPTVYNGSIFASLSIRENLLASLYEKHVNPSLAAGGKGSGAAVTNPYLKLWAEGVSKPEALPELAARAQHWLDRFDLAEVADQQPHEVSAGLRRRAALAAALAVDVPLYILDDPDGAIDAMHRERVVDTLLGTQQRTGATMLLATHDLALAEAISDRIAVLAGGRIVFHGDPAAALAGAERWYRPESAPEQPGPGATVDQPGQQDESAPATEPVAEHAAEPAASSVRGRRLVIPTVLTVAICLFIFLLFLLALPTV